MHVGNFDKRMKISHKSQNFWKKWCTTKCRPFWREIQYFSEKSKSSKNTMYVINYGEKYEFFLEKSTFLVVTVVVNFGEKNPQKSKKK